MNNLFNVIPERPADEVFEILVKSRAVRIERIVSRGHVSPLSGWYDQDDEEWVVVLQGAGKIVYEDGAEFLLGAGDYMTIAAHQKHKVCWTDPNLNTVWLAVFYQS